MDNNFDVLSDGLALLCSSDSGMENIIAPRREEILSLLAGYIAEIERYNPALSIVGTNDRRELIIRHILDSLAPLGIISRLLAKDTAAQMAGNPAYRVADVGSGAGLPGIPLAIVLPRAKFTLIERSGRRATFLRNTRTVLGIGNVTVEEGEMEKVKPGRFSLVTFRAFRPLEPKIYKKLHRLCAEDGVLAAYKGRLEKIHAEMAALEGALPNLTGSWELLPCPVPFLNEQRHLVVVH